MTETDDTCVECGESLEINQDWILRDTSLLGTEATGPLSDAYIHRDCASDEHIQHVLEVSDA